MAIGDFSTLWRSCIGPPSQPKLASILPNKRLSYCRLTGCARNDSERVHWSFFLTIISREVVKMGCLCNINVWRRKSGNSMEGFYSHLSCISRIFRPECSFDRQEAMNPCIQASDFSPPCPGAQGRGNGFCRFVKKLDNQTKTRIPSLAA